MALIEARTRQDYDTFVQGRPKQCTYRWRTLNTVTGVKTPVDTSSHTLAAILTWDDLEAPIDLSADLTLDDEGNVTGIIEPEVFEDMPFGRHSGTTITLDFFPASGAPTTAIIPIRHVKAPVNV